MTTINVNTFLVIINRYCSGTSEKEMMIYTAHAKADFNNLLGELSSVIEELGCRDKASDALFMYLMKIRTGRSHEEIGLHFNVSRTTVQRRCDLVRSCLRSVIVPQHLNYERNREELASMKTVMSRKLFDDSDDSDCAHLILDGTYIYIEKSRNHQFQKNSFNSHKKRNYLKIMMGVSPDGTIVFALGPFKATENDASIISKVFAADTNATKSYRPQDVMIVDRGFRDSVVDLVNRGFIIQMPACSQNPKLTTKEANETRFVTKIRYEVERLNGVMKNVWKIFSNTIDINYVPNIMADFEIGASLINRRTKTRNDEAKQMEMANGMLSRMNVPNELSIIVEGKPFSKLIRDESFNVLNNFDEVPPLSMDDMEMIAFGFYQIAQARCYLSNHLHQMRETLTIVNFFAEDVRKFCGNLLRDDTRPILLMIKGLKSRFVSSKTYRVFVLIDKNKLGRESILQYCCNCKVGSRTVGCCAHVMALIFYICYAPNNGGVNEVAKHLKNVFEENNYEQAHESDFEDSDFEDTEPYDMYLP